MPKFQEKLPKQYYGHFLRDFDDHFIIGSDNFREASSIMKKKGKTKLEINAEFHRPKDLNFLDYFDFVTEIHLICIPVDLNILNRHKSLKLLNIEPGKNKYSGELDLGNLENLETLLFEKTFTGLESIHGHHTLKNLTIYDFPYFELNQLTGIENLEKVKLVNPNIINLNGIKNLKKLKALELLKAVHLEDLSPLKGLNLKKLNLNSSKNLRNSLDVISSFTELILLSLSSLGKLPSLQFLNNLTKLEYLNFLGTRVLDNDLEPVNHLNSNHSLRFAIFKNHPKYNYKKEQFGSDVPDPVHLLEQLNLKL